MFHAEWEKEVRGTVAITFPWGDNNPGCLLASAFGNDTSSNCVGDPNAVISHPDGVRQDGPFNMADNGWEWVSDWYSDNY